MSLTLKNLDLKKINAPYPIGYIDIFYPKKVVKNCLRKFIHLKTMMI